LFSKHNNYQQTGNVFTVTESTPLADFSGKIYHKIKFTFTCKLYNENVSVASKIVTGGSGYIKYEGSIK